MKKIASVGAALLLSGIIISLLVGCGGSEAPPAAVGGGVDSSAEQILIRGATVELLDVSGAQTGLQLTIPDVSAISGDTIHLLVNLNDIGGVAGFQADLTFDPDLLAAQSVAVTDAIPGTPYELTNIDLIAGTVSVVVAGLVEASSAPVTLLDITFTIASSIGCATTNVGISTTLANPLGEPSAGTLDASGQVNIRIAYLGDIDNDGQASIMDVIKILRMVVGYDDETALADVNEDSKVDILDVIRMLRCVVGLDSWPIGAFGQPQPVEIVSTTPLDGATGVDCSTLLVIVFSVEVAPTSLTYTVIPSATLTPTWNDPDNDTVQLDPTPDLAPGTTYTISGIGVSPVDEFCYEPLSGGEFSFTTRSGGDPPTVAITSPAHGATVSGSFNVDVTATPQEPGATITKIDVTFGGSTQTISAASGTVSFASWIVPNGSYTVTAVATDSLGLTGQDTITVTVDNYLVYAQDTTVATGGNVTVSINMTDTTGVAGFGMTINYDPAALQVVGGDAGVQKGAAVPGDAFLLPNTATAGIITVAAAGTTEFNTAEQQILTIQFQAIGGAGDTVIDLDDTPQAPASLEFYDNMGTKITPGPIALDGTVTIQ